MAVNDKVKTDLIIDVENIIEKHLDKKTKDALERCFELTISTFIDRVGNEIEHESKEHIKMDGLRFYGVDWSIINRILTKYGYCFILF